ncbi:unnamed protein product [Rotaria socialis]|uniref:Uncharacterized protein n=1 Tax=Rotaria socialis TaxID=392032 RepID=A0A821UXH5_9BILA|nr:unnamed protein product [Rotaria socialis]CAF4897229.1 unnamed protein product [Rotaria socialis]CAF4977408.1 unnamed protein product [Rotaria socialis]
MATAGGGEEAAIQRISRMNDVVQEQSWASTDFFEENLIGSVRDYVSIVRSINGLSHESIFLNYVYYQVSKQKTTTKLDYI